MRNVETSIDVLIERFGRDALVREAMHRIICAQCRQRVEVQVVQKGWATRVYHPDPGGEKR